MQTIKVQRPADEYVVHLLIDPDYETDEYGVRSKNAFRDIHVTRVELRVAGELVATADEGMLELLYRGRADLRDWRIEAVGATARGGFIKAECYQQGCGRIECDSAEGHIYAEQRFLAFYTAGHLSVVCNGGPMLNESGSPITA